MAMKKTSRSIDDVTDPSCDLCAQKRRKTTEGLDKILILNEVGIECHRYGNIEEAKSSFNEALGKISGICSGVSFTTSTSISTIAKGQPLLGADFREREYDEGMHVYSTPLHLTETKCHVTLVSTLFYNIGQTCLRKREFEDARKFFKRALEVISNGKDISESADVIGQIKVNHNIGYCCFRLGELAESLKYYQESLDQVKAYPAPEKLDLAIACNCVAMLKLRSKTCDSQQCMELLSISLDCYTSTIGRHSLGAATILFNIGQNHFFRKEYDGALSSFQESLRIRRTFIGDEKSIGVAVVVFGIGQSYHRLGRLDEAMANFDKFLALRESDDIQAGDLVTTLAAMNSKAIIHRDKGDLCEAQLVFEKALKVGMETFGGYHINLAPTLINLGSLSFQMGKFDTALIMYEECLKVQGQTLEPTNPEIISTLLNIAEVHWQTGNYRGSWSTFKEILTLQVQSIGATSLPVASTISSMAFIYCQIGQHDDALELYQEALRIRRECYNDEDHKDIIATLNTTGLVLCKLKEFKLAKESFEECLRSRIRILGPNHLDVSILLHNLAAVYLDMGNEEESIELFQQALCIREKQPKPDQSLIASTIHHLGQAYQINGQLEKAAECFERGLQLERDGGNDLVVTRKLLNLIANIKMMIASVDEMMECFVEASRLRKPDEKEDFVDFLLVTGHNFFDLSRLHPKCAPTA